MRCDIRGFHKNRNLEHIVIYSKITKNLKRIHNYFLTVPLFLGHPVYSFIIFAVLHIIASKQRSLN